MPISIPTYPECQTKFRDFPEAFDGMSAHQVLALATSFVSRHTKCFKCCNFSTFLVAEAMLKGYPAAKTPARNKYRYYRELPDPAVDDLPYAVKLLAFHLR